MPIAPAPSGRGHRKKFPTAKIIDMLPVGPGLRRGKKRAVENEEDDHEDQNRRTEKSPTVPTSILPTNEESLDEGEG